MKGYRVYLTKSREIASLLYDAHTGNIGENGLSSVGYGCTTEDIRIPQIYHNKGYFYCMLEYQKMKNQSYEIVFA